MRIISFILLIINYSLLIVSNSPSLADTTGRWFTRAPLPTPRQEIPHAVLNGRIYVPGGLGSGGIGSTIVEVFNPASNLWLAIAPLPEPLHHLGFAAANGKLYVLGGYIGNTFNPTNRVYEYNPDSNLWRQKTPMPVTRGAHVAIEYQGKIYVIGGVIGGIGVTGRNDVYDPINNTWQNKTSMPTVREHLAGSVIDSLIYIVGGRVGSSNRNTLEAYSPFSNLWYSKANMPTARGGLAAATLLGKLYAFGGEIPGVFPQNEEYNPLTNTWRTMAPMLTPRHGIGAATVGDTIFIIGGATVQGFGVTNVNEAFTLAPISGISLIGTKIPESFALYQNYPNPFNPITKIRFDISASPLSEGEGLGVRLTIYDLLGREIATLVNEQLKPGSYEVEFDGTNYPSGVYFYKMTTGDFSDTKKMLLIK